MAGAYGKERTPRGMGWVKDQWMLMPHKGKIRKSILKFVMALTPNSRSTHHLKKYFQTGRITKQAASQVFNDWKKVIEASLTGAAAAIWASMFAILPVHAATLLLIPIIKSILRAAVALMLPELIPGGVEAMRFTKKRYDKGSERLKKGIRDTAKQKGIIDQANKMIKRAEKEGKGGLFKF
jgi:hypothetical protein